MKTKPHVLVFCHQLIPSVTVGVTCLLNYLNRQDTLTYEFVELINIKYTHIEKADIIICVRGYTSYELNLLELAKKKGRFIVYFLDDDLMSLPKRVLSYSKEFIELANNYIPKIIKICDVFWTTSPIICERYSQYNIRSYVINAPTLNQNLSEYGKKKESDNIKIVFAGSKDHKLFLDQFLGNCIKKLLGKYGDKITFYVMGAKPDFVDTISEINYLPYLDNLEAYRASLSKLNIDIGLAPLPKEYFFEAKYFNKYLEYSSMGIAGVYSNVNPFIQVIRNSYNGILVENQEDKWIESISLLIENISLRNNIILNSRKDIADIFSYENISERLLQSVPEFNSFYIEYKKFMLVDKVQFYVYNSYTITLILQYFKQYHIKAPFIILKKIIKKILKLLKRNKNGN